MKYYAYIVIKAKVCMNFCMLLCCLLIHATTTGPILFYLLRYIATKADINYNSLFPSPVVVLVVPGCATPPRPKLGAVDKGVY